MRIQPIKPMSTGSINNVQFETQSNIGLKPNLTNSIAAGPSYDLDCVRPSLVLDSEYIVTQ